MRKLLKGVFLNKSIHDLYRIKTSRTQAGQGVIEYLLALLLTLSLIIGVARGVGEPFVDNIKNNVFGLVGCMLRLGEGPAQAFNTCSEIQALQVDSEAVGSSGSTGGGSSNSSSNSNDSNNSSSEDSSGSSDSGSDSSPTVRTTPGRGSVDGRARGGGNSSEFGGGDSSSSSNRIKINNDQGGEDGSFGYKGGSENTVVVRRVRRTGQQVGGSFTLVGRQEAINKEDPLVSPVSRKQKIPLGPEKKVTKVSSFVLQKERGPDSNRKDTAPEGFSFIKMIKWALIIAIIVIFLLFTLSQLNSIRKGWTD